MCLDELADFRISKNYGWQVLRMRGERLVQLYYGGRPLEIVPEGVWQSDPNDYALETNDRGDPYQTGFHIFRRQADANFYKNWLVAGRTGVIRKVFFKNVVATGKIAIPTNFRYIRADVIVARERLVESKLSKRRNENEPT